MKDEPRLENIEQLTNLLEADPNEHAMKEIATLFVNAMNDWPTPNQTNINEYIGELYNYFGNPITKDTILSKTTSNSNEDSWRKESASSVIEIMNLAEEHYNWQSFEQTVQEMINYYQVQLKMMNSEDSVKELGTYDEKLDLSEYQYPTLELLPSSLQTLLAKIGKEASQYKLPLLLNGLGDMKLRELYHHPNILLAGTIASGKTQFVYNQLAMWLYLYHPAQLKLVICRSKPIDYNALTKLEKHFLATLPGAQTPFVEGRQTRPTIDAIILECEQRLDLFQKAGVKAIEDYNIKFVNRTLDPTLGHRYLPDIVLVMDDLQTFLDEDTTKSLIVLTQMNLYTGIYLLAVTSQIMSRNISPQLRANFSVRIGMKLMSQNESKKILDRVGAEKLTSPGELIYEQGERLVKGTQPHIEYNFMSSICEFIGGQRSYPSAYLLPVYEIESPSIDDFDIETRDHLLREAAQLIVMHQQGSTALIQRKLKIGYNRAGRIIDQLEAAGIIGPFDGAQPRDVLFPDEYTLNLYLDSLTKNNYEIDEHTGPLFSPAKIKEQKGSIEQKTTRPDTKPSFENQNAKPLEQITPVIKKSDFQSKHPYHQSKQITSKKINSNGYKYILVLVAFISLLIYWFGGWEALLKWLR